MARKERAVLISPKELMINSDQANLDRSLPILLEVETTVYLIMIIYRIVSISFSKKMVKS